MQERSTGQTTSLPPWATDGGSSTNVPKSFLPAKREAILICFMVPFGEETEGLQRIRQLIQLRVLGLRSGDEDGNVGVGVSLKL